MIIDFIIYYRILSMKSVHYQKNQKIIVHTLRKIYIIISLPYLNLSHAYIVRTNEFALMSRVKV